MRPNCRYAPKPSRPYSFLSPKELLSTDLKEVVDYDFPEGRERKTSISTRVSQNYFRNTLLLNYGSRRCLTGLTNPRFSLQASSSPAQHQTQRPRNLLPAMACLHDEAFDQGLITITKDLKIAASSTVSH